MQSKAATVPEYLASLPADRRATIEAVRAVILKNLDPVFTECMGYGMMGWAVPHSVYPAGYHCNPSQPLPYAGMASQKQGISLYLMGLYMDPALTAWFKQAWTKTGRKLDMGRSCIRFKKLEDVPLEVVGEAIRRMPAKKYISIYESNLKKGGGAMGGGAKKKAKAPAKKKAAAPPRKKAASAAKKAPAKKG